MPANIVDFRNQFKGTRNNRFKIVLTPPATGTPAKGASAVTIQSDLTLYGKATALPTASIGMIPVPWMGRVIKFSGERTFADWSVQLYDSGEAEGDVRRSMMNWLEAMNTARTHDISYNYTGTAEIHWDDLAGTQSSNHNVQNGFKRKVKLNGVFPIDVGELQLSYDNVDQFSEFPVTFAYDFWEYM